MSPRKQSLTKCLKCDHEIGHESKNVKMVMCPSPEKISKGFLSHEYKERS